MKEKIKDLISITGIPVLIASLCCLAPVVLVLLGLGTVSFAAGLTDLLDGRYRWIFNIAGIATLIGSLVFYFRKKGVCTLDHVKKRRNEIINKILLSGIVALVAYYLFFYGLITYVGRLLKIW